MQELYYGKFEYTLDEKKRVRLPSEFKSELGVNVKIAEGKGKYLVVYGERDFETKKREVIEEFEKDPSVLNEMKRREFLAGIRTLKKDNQDRYYIPAEMAEYAELKTDVLIVGGVGGLEIWSKENFEKRYKLDVAYSKEHAIEKQKQEAEWEMEVEREFMEKFIRKRKLKELEKLYGKLDEDENK